MWPRLVITQIVSTNGSGTTALLMTSAIRFSMQPSVVQCQDREPMEFKFSIQGICILLPSNFYPLFTFIFDETVCIINIHI